MKRTADVTRSLAALALCAATAPAARAQSPAPGAPVPGAEHKRLGYFVGRWTTSGEMKAGVFGPGGPVTGSESCEWFAGNFHLVCHAEGSSAAGSFKGMSVMGWDADAKAYTHDAYNSMGMTARSRGTAAGDTWTWTSESRMDGRALKGRFVVKELGPTAYTFKWEASVDGGPMTLVMEGKGTKAN
jgi:hypothetical protein